MNNDHVILAFILTFLAGLSTGAGSLAAFFSKRIDHKFLSGALGFSAGVMIFVSLADIFPEAVSRLSETFPENKAYLFAVLSFFGGIGLIGLIDKLVPKGENPHELRDIDECDTSNSCLMRMGIMSAIAIGIHNFPEGLATFFSAIHDQKLGISVAAAVAIHNIPEGIAISVPIYYATKSRKKALYYSLLSGFSEPVGALLGYFFLQELFGAVLFGITFAAVAGIMVFISLDELLPSAEKYGEHHIAVYGLVSGMFVMSMSIFLFM